LSALVDPSIRSELSQVARAAIDALGSSGWQSVFGAIDEKSEEEKTESLKRAAARVVTPTKPWAA